MSHLPIVVVGAGIVGVSTAIWLTRAGRRVILVDKDAPGQATSYGNAGLIAGWAIAPVSSPKLWRDGPAQLLNPNSALFLKWSSLPSILPWLTRFMANATDVKTRKIVRNLIPLLLDAVDQHKALVRGTPVETWVHDSKMNFVYPSRKAFEADAYSWRMKQLGGLEPTVLTGPEVQEAEPILGQSNGCIAVLDGFGHITNPGGYVSALASHFEAEGGTILQAKIEDFVKTDGRITQVATDRGPIECDTAIVTAGIWSGDLMGKLGLSVPMITERGYHVIYENPSAVPRNPMLMSDGKFGVNAMDMGLRCAGTVELGDHYKAASTAPLKLIRKKAARAFPALTYSDTREWMGFRPSPSDSTPLIGQIGKSGIYTGFGHQHVGLTGGPKTGRLLAQMITGDMPNIDLAPYDPDRFA